MKQAIYNNPEFGKRVVELRSGGKNWEEIKKLLMSEFDRDTLTVQTVRGAYDTALAMSITYEKRTGKKFNDYTEQLDQLYGAAIKQLERLINAIDTIADKLEEADDVDALKAANIILRMAPTIKNVTSEIRNFMDFQSKQQDKITLQGSKMQMPAHELADRINKTLKSLQRENKITLKK